MDYGKAKDRYLNDATFRALVDTMAAGIDHLQFSPGELREAAVFAEIVHSERNPVPPIKVGSVQSWEAAHGNRHDS
ncbi:MAG: hypothetical protein RIB80_04860 [Rhodospirillales bacterium]